MALEKLRIKVEEQAPTTKTPEPPIYDIDGSIVTDFNALKAQITGLEEEKKRLETLLKAEGVKTLIYANTVAVGTGDCPFASVKLRDKVGSMAMVTLQNRYGVQSATSVEETFAAINSVRKRSGQKPLSENDFVQMVATISINPQALYDADGKFNEDVYKAIQKALRGASMQLVADGKIPPGTKLYTETQAAVVKDDFHQRRWALGIEVNELLQESIPATIAIKAIVG